MTGRNSECLRAYFPIHGIRALYSLIEYPYPSNFQEGDCENLAYGARNSGVITSRPFARSQWKLTLGKCSGSDAKFQTSQNVQGGSGIKARCTITPSHHVVAQPSSQLVSNSQGAQTNIIRRVDVCLTIAFGALRRNSYFTKITDYPIMSNLGSFFTACNTVPPLSTLLKIPRIAISDSFFWQFRFTRHENAAPPWRNENNQFGIPQ
ncbi:hypothetical protein KEM48_010664 [Puccinia striiformis f. sp. tritici PST-130]|nr:hypothetical protein KEM48_010664 [Puccinia striiformis f. sp. tritici PST-130]